MLSLIFIISSIEGLPIIKTWRLNERMYGALTGKSKTMVEQKYGATQFKAWRRGTFFITHKLG